MKNPVVNPVLLDGPAHVGAGTGARCSTVSSHMGSVRA
jgi:hypothetical protein